MVGIHFNTKYSKRVFGYLKAVGFDLNDIEVVTEKNIKDCALIIEFGGKGVRPNHCYVKQWHGSNLALIKPCIQVLDPSTVRTQPFNHYWIVRGLEKAKEIYTSGKIPHKEPVLHLRPKMCEIEEFIKKASSTISAFDIECDIVTKEPTMFGIAYRDGDDIHAMCIPLLESIVHKPVNLWMPSDEAKIWKLIAGYLQNNKHGIVMQNFIFDTLIMSKKGVKASGPLHDTMIAQHLINPEMKKYRHMGLADIGRDHLFCSPWKGIKNFISTESVWKYNARDAGYTLQIFEKQQEKFDEEQKQFYNSVLTPLAAEVLQMCERGWAIDHEFLNEATDWFSNKVKDLRSSLCDIAQDLIPAKITYTLRKGKFAPEAVYVKGIGKPKSEKFSYNSKGEKTLQAVTYSEYEEINHSELMELKKLAEYPCPVLEKKVHTQIFNPGSHMQIKEVFRALGIKLSIKTNKTTGKTSETSDDASLKKLLDKQDCEFAELLLEYRKNDTMLTRYCHLDLDDDNKVRFKITITGTVGSRFSSSKTDWGTGVNSQNLPKATIGEDKKSYRRLIVPHLPDYLILNMDFKQADPHMVAWLSGCDTMLKILQDPKGDLHSHTASVLRGFDITTKPDFDKDTDRDRKIGKASNNGFNYGMHAKTFRGQCRKNGLKLSLAEAMAAYDAYHRAYPEVADCWYADVEAEIRRTRTITTPFGRKRTFYGRMTEDWEWHKLFSEALSYVPQTHVADALNKGNLLFLEACRKNNLRVDWLQQCHDSNMWQVHQDDLDAAAELMIECYNQVVFYIRGQECCFPIDIEYGPSWGDLKEWKK